MSGGCGAVGQEEHCDPEAREVGEERRPTSVRLLGQVVEKDEQGWEGVLGVLFPEPIGVGGLDSGQATGASDALGLDYPGRVVAARHHSYLPVACQTR